MPGQIEYGAKMRRAVLDKRELPVRVVAVPSVLGSDVRDALPADRSRSLRRLRVDFAHRMGGTILTLSQNRIPEPMKTKPQTPEVFRIPCETFDASVLPDGNREPGSDAFEDAVLLHFTTKYANKGWDAAVTVRDGIIRVMAWERDGVDPKDYVIGLLQHRALE
jgi:hypothetical protein